MNRLMMVFLILVSLVSIGFTQDEYVNYQTWDKDAFKLYYKPASTETHARYNITSASITLIMVNGTTYYKTFQLTASDASTYKLFKSTLASIANLDATKHVGSWIVTIPEDVSVYTEMTALDAVVISSNCFGVGNTKFLSVDASSAAAMSFNPTLRAGRSVKIKYAIANVTGTSPTIAVYNESNTALTPSTSMTSESTMYFGVEDTNHPLAVGNPGETCEVRCLTTGSMTAGWLMVGYTIE